MRSHGIPGLLAIKLLAPAGLKYEDANLLAELARWVPDASRHLERLGQLFSVDTLPKLAIALRYNGPLELLSMWLCLFCGRGVVAQDVLMHMKDPEVAIAAAPAAKLDHAFNARQIRNGVARFKAGVERCLYIALPGHRAGVTPRGAPTW